MESKAPSPVTMGGMEFAAHVSRPQTQVSVALFAFIIVGIVAGVRHGFASREWFLIGGSLFSFWASSQFAQQMMIDAVESTAPSYSRASRGAAMFVPMTLAYYAALYEGLWRSLGLLSMFSITFLAARFVFLFLGWRLATALMHFTDIPKQMRNGQIGVADSEIPVAAI